MTAPIVLVTMPWDSLTYASMPLGLLRPVLEREGLAVDVCLYTFDFMEHLAKATDDDEKPVSPADYGSITTEGYLLGVGDWIFAIPPFREIDPAVDEKYFAYLRAQGALEFIDLARRIRALVPSFIDACVADLLARRPRIVGFTTTFSQNVASLVLAKRLKQADPSIQIVFGGGNCDGPMGEALHRTFPFIDVVSRGEGERVVPRLFRELLEGVPITPQAGLCYRKDGQSVAVSSAGAELFPMEQVPPPNLDDYFARLENASFYEAITEKVFIPYESSRGCWWGAIQHCTFCGLNGQTMKFRAKPAQQAFDELIGLVRKHQRIDVQTIDNIISLDYLVELLPLLKEARLDLRIFYETKSNLKKEQVRLMREAGLRILQPGIESLSTPILKLMRKGVTGLQNVRLLKWGAQYGVRIAWNAMYGFPGEPPEEYPRMATAMRSLTHLEAPDFSPVGIHRFSPYFQSPAEHGIEILGPDADYELIYPVDAKTLGDIAYRFRHRHLDGRDVASYVGPFRDAILEWRARAAEDKGGLKYFRGPGFITIVDLRRGGGQRYTLGVVESKIYLACDTGAKPDAIAKALAKAGYGAWSADDVRDYLEELRVARLVYEDEGRYLSLALPDAPFADEPEALPLAEGAPRLALVR